MVTTTSAQVQPARRSIVLIGLVATVLAACSGPAADDAAAGPAATPSETIITAAPQQTTDVAPLGSVQDVLAEELNEWLIDSGTVGAVVAAVLPDGTTASAVAGWSDREARVALEPNANFRIGSITKVYTAALTMQLAAEGQLDLADAVAQYLPEAPAAMTIAQLLSHTSGLRDVDVAAGIFEAIQDPDQVDTSEDTLSATLREPLAFEPGSRQSYSSIGYLVLERVIEAATGQTYEEALRERILEPLGLETTRLEQSDSVLPTPYERLSPSAPQISLAAIPTGGLARAAGAAGALVAPADEVAAFATALFAGEIVDPQSVAAMMDTSDPQLIEYGLGLSLYQIAGERRFGHNGRTIGFASSLRYSPDAAVTVVVLSNDGSAPTDELADDLIGVLSAAVGS